METEQLSSRNPEPLHGGSRWKLMLGKLVSMFQSRSHCQCSPGVVTKRACLEILDSMVKGTCRGVYVLTFPH